MHERTKYKIINPYFPICQFTVTDQFLFIINSRLVMNIRSFDPSYVQFGYLQYVLQKAYTTEGLWSKIKGKNQSKQMKVFDNKLALFSRYKLHLLCITSRRF